jgi:hypothetical protein
MPDPHPLYDTVVLVHVLSAILGFGSLAITGILAAIARGRAGANSSAVQRYFSGATNWASRTIYSVPILGFVLLAMSDNAFRLDEAWVVISLAVWIGAVGLAQLVIWPGERFIAQAARAPATKAGPGLKAVCTRVMVAAAGEVALFVISLVIMLAKPGR